MTTPSQEALWNSPVGEAWVRHAEAFDAILHPFGEAAHTRLDLASDDRVLDIGCGAGATTLELARQVPAGAAHGVDLSAAMVELARHRAQDSDCTNVEFSVTDAGTETFPPGGYSAAFSRMGVMFFPDPAAAFANLASALEEGGQLSFVAFGPVGANPFIFVPLFAAAPVLGIGPPPADGPGPFSLADPDATRALLEGAGFGAVRVEPGPHSVHLGPADDLHTVALRALEQNPVVGAALRAATPEQQQNAVAATAEALADHVEGDDVVLGAGSWVVTSRRAA